LIQDHKTHKAFVQRETKCQHDFGLKN